VSGERRRNLLLAAGATAVTALALEGAGRFIEWRQPPPAVAGYIWDWRVEWEGDFPAFRPGTVAWPREPVNTDGFRDRWHAKERLPYTSRVVALGDSVTFGAGLEPDEAYPQRLESVLRAEGRRVEVFNAGMIGWSTRQERLAYERLIRPYRPDLVLLGVCLNDIPEIQNNLAKPPGWLQAMHERSALVRFVVGGHRREIQRVEQLFTRHDAPVVREAMARFFDEVRALAASTKADGAELRLLVFPFRFQVVDSAPAPLVQAEIEAFCAREGLRCLDARPRLVTVGEKAFVDYDHLSAEGVDAVVDELLTSDVVPRPPSDAEALGARDGDVSRLVRAAEDGDGRVRAAAVAQLGRLGPKAAPATPLLATRAESDTDAAVRADAIAAVAAIDPSPRSLARILPRLHDASAAVRWAAADALATLPREDVRLDDWIAALESSDPYVRSLATWSIGERGPAAGEAALALVKLLQSERAHGSSGAAGALARLQARDAVPALADALQAPEPARRAEIATALGQMGATAGAAVPALEKALADPDDDVRRTAAEALGRIGPAARAALPALLERADDRDWRTRAEALTAVALLGGDAGRARRAFTTALRDPKPSVRARAARGLAGLGDAARDAVPEIAALLADRNRDVQIAAAQSLARLGPVAVSAAPALREAARSDPRARVRREAARALEVVDGGPR
jgi:HEAT repeat protein/lysophospholipase L1-like esterase